MGRPKALLDIGGRPALERILEACREAGLAPPIVVLGAAAEAILAAVSLDPGLVVIHEGWQDGRSSSLQAGLRRIPGGEDFLVYPVDHPFVLPTTLRCLVRAMHTAPPGTLVLAPVHAGRRGHPILCAAGLRSEIERLAPDAPLRDVVRREGARVVAVEVGDAGVLQDLDTPEDYARALGARKAGKGTFAL